MLRRGVLAQADDPESGRDRTKKQRSKETEGVRHVVFGRVVTRAGALRRILSAVLATTRRRVNALQLTEAATLRVILDGR